MKVILGGGDSADDERPLNEILAGWIGSQGRLLYWPMALRGIRAFDSCYEWITSALNPLGITNITMWTELAGHSKHELDEFVGVSIGGGNTFSLLAEVRESGFDHHLKSFASTGKPVYGGSAGAVLLGSDIRIVEHVDTNHVGITGTTGLDLARRYAIWPHYEPKHDEWIRTYIGRHNITVLAIPERSGIVIEGEELRRAGFESAFWFDGSSKSEV